MYVLVLQLYFAKLFLIRYLRHNFAWSNCEPPSHLLQRTGRFQREFARASCQVAAELFEAAKIETQPLAVKSVAANRKSNCSTSGSFGLGVAIANRLLHLVGMRLMTG